MYLEDVRKEGLTVNIVDHPLVQHKLALMRQKETGSKDFRELLEEIAMLMVYEITRDLPMEEVEIETPIAPCRAKMLSGKKLALIPILRAGLGMIGGPPCASVISDFTAIPTRCSPSNTTASCRPISVNARSSSPIPCLQPAAAPSPH